MQPYQLFDTSLLMMKWIVNCILFAFSLLMPKVEASHYAGSTLTAGYAGVNNRYYIKFDFYRDCGGITPPNNIVVFLEMNGIVTDTVVLPLISIVDQTDSTCIVLSGNCMSLPPMGTAKYTYQDTMLLTVQGNYRIWTTDCCYSLPGSLNNYHVEAYLKVDSIVNDRLPDFSSLPRFFFCVNTWNTFNSFAVDADGDSVVYSLLPVTLYDTATLTTQPFPYGPGLNYINFTYMASPPSLDSSSGLLSFYPLSQMVSIVAIKADSYRNGLHIGSAMRETATYSVMSNGLNDLSGKPVSIYPTIATSEVKVTGLEDFSFSIYDAQGRIHIANSNTGNSVNINELENGFYFIRISDERKSCVFRFLKR